MRAADGTIDVVQGHQWSERAPAAAGDKDAMMEIVKADAITAGTIYPPGGTVAQGDPIPRDTFVRSQSDSVLDRMKNLPALLKKTAAEILFSDNKKDIQDKTIHELALWEQKKGFTSNSDAVCDHKTGTVYTGVEPRDSSNHNYWRLRAFDKDGNEKWTFRKDYAKCTPVIDGEGNIHVRSNDTLYVLYDNGQVKWSFKQPRGGWEEAPPVLGPNGEEFIISGNPDAIGCHAKNMRLYAVKDGKELWHYDAVATYGGDHRVIVGKDGTIYLSAIWQRKAYSFGGLMGVDFKEFPSLIALNPDGTEKFVKDVKNWDIYTKGNISEGADGTIYACNGMHRVTAFSPGGKEKWIYTLKDKTSVAGNNSAYSRFYAAPLCDAEGNIIVASMPVSNYPEGYLIKLDKEGRELWNTTIAGGAATSPRIGPDGKIYVGSGYGELLAFDKSGVQTDKFSLGDMWGNDFDFGADGEIYLNTKDRIIALQPDRMKIAEKKKEEAGEMVRALDEQEDEGKSINVEDEFVIIDGVRLPVGHGTMKHLLGRKTLKQTGK